VKNAFSEISRTYLHVVLKKNPILILTLITNKDKVLLFRACQETGGRDRAGARKCPQNDPWGVVNSARKKKFFNSLLTHFIHFQLQILPLQFPSNVKVNHSCCSEIPHLRHAK
jgi:predicted TIM-barrel fold metal-dependent hydrolase